MIVKKHSCRDCGSFNIVKNGFNKYGGRQYRRKDCGASKVLEPGVKYSEAKKEEILRVYQERAREEWREHSGFPVRPLSTG